MKTDATFSVDFVVRKKKAEPKRGLIYARITVDGGLPKEISLKEDVQVSMWDSRAECLKGKNSEVKKINDYIDDVRSRIRAKYRELQEGNKPITAQLIKTAYLGQFIKRTGHSLFDLWKEHLRLNPDKLVPGTLKNYTATEKYLKAFISKNYHREDLYLVELDFAFITELEHYIRNFPIKAHDPCNGNGVYKHLERLCKVIVWGVKLGWVKADPFILYSWTPDKAKPRKLDLLELSRIERRKFENPQLDYARDLFIFSCYTGLAYTDAISLKESEFSITNDGIWFLMTYRNKSDELSPVPILKIAQNLIVKYRDLPRSISNGTVFPPISNQQINRSLKIIQEICGISKELTYHVARHTFATTITLKNKVPFETVSALLGHKKLSTTQIYAQVDEEKILADIGGVEERLEGFKSKLPADLKMMLKP